MTTTNDVVPRGEDMKNSCHSELVSESKNMTNLPPHPSGFPYGRSEASPAGEQMERTGATLRQRHSASMEEIQDSPLPQGARERTRVAFTLAEVLITLGIIGVVAAMTIPTLMTKVHRQKVETHLKKFNSTMNQAIRHSIAEHDDIPFDFTDIEDNNNSDKVLAWYNEYIIKYLSGASIVRLNDERVKVLLKDGTGFNSYLQRTVNNDLWIFYCIDPSKDCDFDTYNGKNSFLFQYKPNEKFMTPARASWSDEECKSTCYFSGPWSETNWRKGQCCAELIKRNGWKIPDDYPWIK